MLPSIAGVVRKPTPTLSAFSPATMSTPVHPRKILIVGGGPTGLVTLRNLTERGDFDRVELVERRDDVGGVW